ncbi:hypothetical protein [Deinococcus cellulosilyticus]|uniref:Uncharacterized protein n=1 Tax=Deinococcus cellulosilyticus (strain DSM 18568 / NBRC 106333 / KACC 11606 / 5516J-15) TaxID=1223518 RepID=A0A511N420_DEIC1|nr:hypothetical protein [Deinococcus cellulosilyticus]GEM47619.1 hypothetical protein DC3_32540 [Deinococcus cellulosilyticus NBRC 106333 = KACC 11606]
MPKAYLVMDRDYLYNDETYAPWFDDNICTEPIRILDTREEAEQFARELALPRFRNLLLGDYSLGSPDQVTSLSLPELYEKLSEATGDVSILQAGRKSPKTAWADIEIPAHLSDERLHQVMDVLDRIRFYEVVESTSEDPQALEQARTLINAGVVDPSQQLYRAYRVPEEDIAEAVKLFGLEFEPFDGGL